MIVCNGLKLQLLLGDPQATTTGCWKIEEYLGCHGSPHLPDAGVLLGLAHPPSDQLLGYLPEYPGSEPPQPPSLGSSTVVVWDFGLPFPTHFVSS